MKISISVTLIFTRQPFTTPRQEKLLKNCSGIKTTTSFLSFLKVFFKFLFLFFFKSFKTKQYQRYLRTYKILIPIFGCFLLRMSGPGIGQVPLTCSEHENSLTSVQIIESEFVKSVTEG